MQAQGLGSPDFLGADTTTIRAGYQIAYQLPGDSLSWVDVDVGNMPGFVYEPTDFGDGTFRDLTNIDIPLDIGDARPFEPIPITERSQTLRVHSEDYATPYVQTITFGITRQIRRNLTLDVKYVGTRGVKLHETFDLNVPDIRGNDLLTALEVTRAGGDAAVFDQMMAGLDIGSGVIGVDITGSEALRRHSDTRTDIANGDFADVADWLNTTNAGTVQTGDGIIRGGLLRSSGLFPENYITANPQFGSVVLAGNLNNSNYHSLQLQGTLRPTNGITYQATYTWSRSLGIFAQGGDGYRDPTRRYLDYTLQSNHRTHAFRSFGTFELPFGPGRPIGGNAGGWLARAIEGWTLGTVVNLTSGEPLTIGSGQSLYGSGVPDVAGDFPRGGEVIWEEGDTFGTYFPQQYERVNDPQCTALPEGPANLPGRCTIDALADAGGNIVLRHAEPGEIGTLGLNTIEGPGRWDVDMNIQKNIQIDETKSVTFRLDAENVFNHATPGDPSLNLNSGLFGEIDSKSGNRTVQGQVRFDW